jgi:hypothetical protein
MRLMYISMTPEVQNPLMTEKGSDVLTLRGPVSDRATFVSLQHSDQTGS